MGRIDFQGKEGSYDTIHIWIKYWYGKATKCEKCHTRKAKMYQWANISGKYLRNRKDYIQLCASCHALMDRGNHCRNGHKYTKENMWMRKRKGQNSHRVCRKCQRTYYRNYQLRKKLLCVEE